MVSAIPKWLFEKAKQNLDPKFTSSPDNTFFQLSSTIKVNLLKSKSKDYYRLFINKVNPELKAPRKWARDLQFNDIELSGYFKNLKSICKENNLREFYFKFLHRIIVTRKGTLFIWYRVQPAHAYIVKSLTQLAILSSTVDGRKNFSPKLLNGSTKKMAPPSHLI